MPQTFAQLFYETSRAACKNTQAFIVDQLTNTKSVREPVMADDPQNAEKVAALVVLSNVTCKLLYGSGYMIYGIFLGLIPEKKRVLELVRTGFVDEVNPDDAEVKYITTVTSSETLSKKDIDPDQSKSGVFSYAYKGVTTDLATGEEIKTVNVNNPRLIKRPFIPGLDTAPETLDYTTQQKKVAGTKAIAVLGGGSYFRAGLSTALYGAHDAIVGTATLLHQGGSKLAEVFRKSRP